MSEIQRETSSHKRFFGFGEAVFDIAYLAAAFGAGGLVLSRGSDNLHMLAGGMSLVLAGGDLFHLVPRIAVILTGDSERFTRALRVGKIVTSISMTVFYLMLWNFGALLFPVIPAWQSRVFYALGAVRIFLCLLPQNFGSEIGGICRNIPFVLIGGMAARLYALNAGVCAALAPMSVAIVLSFAFYIPVVLWAGRNPKLGMLMLPKTCMYLWMMYMFVSVAA